MIETSVCQNKAECDISGIRNGQTKFEGKMTDTLEKKLNAIMVEKQAQKLCEEFCSELQATC
jgi:hypothetical protein